MEKPDPEMINGLILSGALEAAGVNEDGSLTYKFTEKAKDLVPELYNVFMENFYSSLMTLWEKGFINMDITQKNPTVTVLVSKFTDSNAMDSLTDEERKSLYFVISAMKDK